VQPAVGEAERRAALQRVLRSATLAHSESLRRLLAYLGEKALNGATADLKEYTIGLEAFGKPESYDPQQDSTVRVLASKLRHKLDEYYATEGAGDPVRIELPRGHYRLRFDLQRQADRAFSRVQLRRWQYATFGLGIITLVLLLLAVTRWVPESRAARTAVPAAPFRTPELELLWRPFLEGGRPVLLVLGTPLFAKFSGGFFRSPRLNDWEAAASSETVRGVQKLLGSDYAVPWHNFTGIGEATGAFLLAQLLAERRVPVMLKRSSAVAWEDLEHHNVIFLGSPKFNRQLLDLAASGDFVIEGGVIRNRNPRPGEATEYRDVWPNKAEIAEDYALIHHLPGLHGRGHILILGSSSTQGTWAAAQYVTEPAHVKELVARLRLSVSGRLPPAYQVVIRARFKQDVPVEVSYVTHRYPPSTSDASRRGSGLPIQVHR
jgi:hypothetical protein